MKLISFLSLFREFMPLLSESSKYESLIKLGSQVTENMLLDKNRIVKIADFGVSRLEASNLSEMTGYIGSPGYMAPEVLDSKPYDKKCDIYSFGICLWEINCCKKPYSKYSSSNISQLINDVVYKNVRPEIPKSCPSSLANVMRRCWDAEPRKRPGMEEVVTMLEEIDSSRHHHGCFWFDLQINRPAASMQLLELFVELGFLMYSFVVVDIDIL